MIALELKILFCCKKVVTMVLEKTLSNIKGSLEFDEMID
jgi:hypothetical protein